jgi:diaphanous 1
MSLADSDVLVILMKTAYCYEQRVKSIMFKNIYRDELVDIHRKIDLFFECFEFLENNKILHSWLEIILLYGNYLNGTSNRGGAYGFKLDTLAKISEVKSTDNKKTLFYYIVEYVGETKTEEMFSIVPHLEKFARCKLILI